MSKNLFRRPFSRDCPSFGFFLLPSHAPSPPPGSLTPPPLRLPPAPPPHNSNRYLQQRQHGRNGREARILGYYPSRLRCQIRDVIHGLFTVRSGTLKAASFAAIYLTQPDIRGDSKYSRHNFNPNNWIIRRASIRLH